jgi:hypothetical protein
LKAIILQVYRDFFNSETDTAEAEKAQVLGLDGLERPQGTLGLLRGAGGRVTAGRGPARCRGQARATISLPPRRPPENHLHHRSGLETELAVDSPGTQKINEPEGA